MTEYFDKSSINRSHPEGVGGETYPLFIDRERDNITEV